MARTSVKDHRGLLERLNALGWVCTGWQPVHRAWRFRHLASDHIAWIRSGDEVDAVRQMAEQLETGHDDHPATPSSSG